MSRSPRLPVTWFKPSCRPSPQEVAQYARAIAGMADEFAGTEESRLREAELQLWLWRSELAGGDDDTPARRGPPPVRRGRR